MANRENLINTVTQGDAWSLLESGGWGDVGTCIFSPPSYGFLANAPNEAAYMVRITRLFHLLRKWIRPDGAVWYVGSDTTESVQFIPERICMLAREVGWHVKKRFFRPVKDEPDHVFLLTNGCEPFRPKHPIFEGYVWRYEVEGEKLGYHWRRFPVHMAKLMIDATCPTGAIVLDPFMGSGTVAKAAEELGRDWIGFDIDEKAVAIANG